MQANCEFCNQKFDKRNHKERYCSVDCNKRNKIKQANERWASPKPPRKINRYFRSLKDPEKLES